MTLSADYFHDLYRDSVDPWSFEDRWYEQRKRAITLSALPERHYHSAFEPGCSIGLLTLGLAERCDSLIASDLSPVALREASARLVPHPRVRLQQLRLPEEWPSGTFDLIVLSEILYYFGTEDLQRVIQRSVASLTPLGTLLAVHWRRNVADYPQTGDDVQAEVKTHVEGHMALVAHHVETDFDLAVYLKRADDRDDDDLSVGARGGLR